MNDSIFWSFTEQQTARPAMKRESGGIVTKKWGDVHRRTRDDIPTKVGREGDESKVNRRGKKSPTYYSLQRTTRIRRKRNARMKR